MTVVHGSENLSVYHHGFYWGMMSKNILFIHLRNCAINLLINSPLVIFQFSHCKPENLGLFGLMSVYFLYVLWSAHCCKKAFSNFIESLFKPKVHFRMKMVCCSTALKILFVFDSKIQNIGHLKALFSDITMSLPYRIREYFTNQSPKILLVMVWRNHYHY